MTRSDPVVQVLYANPNENGGTVRANVLADNRFGGGLSFELTFVGAELYKYSVERISPGPLPNASTLRQVPIDHLRRTCLAYLQQGPQELRPDLAALLGRWGDTTTPREMKLVKLAARYVALLSERAPTKALVAETRFSRDYVEQLLAGAREAGLLTPPPAKGVAGGELTARALAILEKEQD